MELDIAREALRMNGYTLTPVYVPFARVLIQLKRGTVDGALTINEASGLKYSGSHITYQNVAVSIQSKKYKINKIDDLWDKEIIAFQNAAKYLGQEFLEISKASPSYREIANQELQIAVLYKRKEAVIVLDINIFKYYRQKTKKVDTDIPVVIHRIFPESRYKVGFKNSEVRDAFNESLKSLRQSGEYTKIIRRYVR